MISKFNGYRVCYNKRVNSLNTVQKIFRLQDKKSTLNSSLIKCRFLPPFSTYTSSYIYIFFFIEQSQSKKPAKRDALSVHVAIIISHHSTSCIQRLSSLQLSPPVLQKIYFTLYTNICYFSTRTKRKYKKYIVHLQKNRIIFPSNIFACRYGIAAAIDSYK